VCDERDGWCLPHTTDNLRDIISSMIKKLVRTQKPSKNNNNNNNNNITPVLWALLLCPLAAILAPSGGWVAGRVGGGHQDGH